jgi:hypothetical protein
MRARTTPVAAERAIARFDTEAREREQQEAEEHATYERWLAEQRAKQERSRAVEAKWGAPDAKRREIEQRKKDG